MSGLLKAFQMSIGVKADTTEVDELTKTIEDLDKQIENLHNKQKTASKEEKQDIKKQIEELKQKKEEIRKQAKEIEKANQIISSSTDALKSKFSSLSKVVLGSFSVGGLFSSFFIGQKYDSIKDLNKDLMSIGITGGKVFDLLNASQSSTMTDLSSVSREIQDLVKAQREYKTFGFTDKTQFSLFGASVNEDINTIISKFQKKIRGMSDTMGREFAEKMGLSQMYEVVKLSDEEIKKMRGSDVLSMDSFDKMKQTMNQISQLKNNLNSAKDSIVISFAPLITTILKNINTFLNSNIIKSLVSLLKKIVGAVNSLATFLDPTGFKVMFSTLFGFGLAKAFAKLGLGSFFSSIKSLGLKRVFTTITGMMKKLVLASLGSFLIGAIVEDLFAWFSGNGAKSLLGEVFGEVEWGQKIVIALEGLTALLTAYFVKQGVKGLFDGIPIVDGLIGTIAGATAGGLTMFGAKKLNDNVLFKKDDILTNNIPAPAKQDMSSSVFNNTNNNISNNNTNNNTSNSKNTTITNNFTIDGSKNPFQTGQELKRIMNQINFENQRKDYYVNQMN